MYMQCFWGWFKDMGTLVDGPPDFGCSIGHSNTLQAQMIFLHLLFFLQRGYALHNIQFHGALDLLVVLELCYIALKLHKLCFLKEVNQWFVPFKWKWKESWHVFKYSKEPTLANHQQHLFCKFVVLYLIVDMRYHHIITIKDKWS